MDSLRSVAGWLVVVLLLLSRKANRLKEAWALLIPLAAIYLLLAVVERQLNAYLIFHYHQYICSALADLFRYLALSLAILLAIADRLDIPWRPLRWVLVLLFLLLCADVQIASNGWPFLDTGNWTFFFGLILLLFMVGQSLVHAVLRRFVRPPRFRWWYGAFCLVLGLVPLLTLGVVEAYFSRSPQLQSTQEQYRIVVVLAGALTPPYLLLFAFILLAVRSPLYRDRLARAFGLTSLVPVSMARPGSPDAPPQPAPEKPAPASCPQPYEP